VKIRAILLPGAKILGGAAGRAVVGPRLGGVLGEHEGGEHQTTELAAGVGGGMDAAARRRAGLWPPPHRRGRPGREHGREVVEWLQSAMDGVM
jgi:hypothetical protein